MSADNWAICPKCRVTDDAKHEKALADLAKQYGKVSAADYVSKFEALKVRKSLEPTFREDYGMGMDESGEFSVSYSGRCSRCGFGHTFRHSQALPLDK